MTDVAYEYKSFEKNRRMFQLPENAAIYELRIVYMGGNLKMVFIYYDTIYKLLNL